ncbi:hypothetical protein AAHC03_01002 [Spirometra sp. Aus1]
MKVFPSAEINSTGGLPGPILFHETPSIIFLSSSCHCLRWTQQKLNYVPISVVRLRRRTDRRSHGTLIFGVQHFLGAVMA